MVTCSDGGMCSTKKPSCSSTWSDRTTWGVVEDEHGALVREVAEGHHQARDEHPPRVGADLGEAQRFVQVLRERLGQPRTT
jgi:hypothetical protein